MSLTSLTAVASLPHIGADLIALAVLVGPLYARRHSRKDLTAAYIGVNIGILAVTLLLSSSEVGAGLGLGLFGVLSIIRLRSTELSQHEVAYFFAALALGLLGGIQTAPIPLVSALMALVVASLWICDHPALMGRNRHQVILLDRAISDEPILTAHLEQLLGGRVQSLEVRRLDMVNDTTLVDVRFRMPRSQRRRARHEEPVMSQPAPPSAPHAVPRPEPRPAFQVVDPMSQPSAWPDGMPMNRSARQPVATRPM
ncbi:DUF4956 domain-containing protein [Actinomyces slackii]|uniref:DUF4956 domain-containing protein n=1 Tax=Actinomyces slackii TaxID=52774 RepID=A0A3S5EM31_9ACTO|nr:DUF4956 domain-containing protein [Actinomyces slackii]VEG73891.1 Uncharacterised protein [Actinomyces slackii]